MAKFQTVKGMRDFLPEDAILRDKAFTIIKNVFERFGFSPAITPSLEYYEVFANKFSIGQENLKNIYSFDDKSGRKLALRFDQTVPLARLIACNPQLPKPFKRYEISRVWRYEEIKRGRYREFWQCDIDTIGTKSMAADAEIIACALQALIELGFNDIKIKINNRKILNDIIEVENKNDVLRVIDKLDKIGESNVKKELQKLNIDKKQIQKIFDVISIKGNEKVLAKLESIVKTDEGKNGLNELKEVIEILKCYFDEKYFEIDLSLARGLDYYTSTIFEIVSGDKSIGSIAGGGRYDKMISKFAESKEDIPAVGIALGIERIIELIKLKNDKKKTVTQIFVASVSDENKKDVIKIAKDLRQKGFKVETDISGRKLSKQLEYANSLSIPFCLIVGSEEVKKGVYKLKDMGKGKEIDCSLDEIVNVLKDRIF
ncbi:MAG: histidine--tRNA ligase [Candidatus Aenigmatarchaeota archaeon]|nr:histidine--tRNA ligase [Candidatus Aenigmarchaeota archaeon]